MSKGEYLDHPCGLGPFVYKHHLDVWINMYIYIHIHTYIYIHLNIYYIYAISGAGEIHGTAFGAGCKPYIPLGPAGGQVVTKITEYFWSFETNYVLEAFLATGCWVEGAYT